jgi:hypothetical protein
MNKSAAKTPARVMYSLKMDFAIPSLFQYKMSLKEEAVSNTR